MKINKVDRRIYYSLINSVLAEPLPLLDTVSHIIRIEIERLIQDEL